MKRESEVAQSCLTLSDPIDCSPPGFSVHGIFQARVLEWGAIAFSNVHRQPLNFLATLSSSKNLFEILSSKIPTPHAPTPEARGGGLEDQPHVQGAVDEWAPEGLEELSHFEGQEGWQ